MFYRHDLGVHDGISRSEWLLNVMRTFLDRRRVVGGMGGQSVKMPRVLKVAMSPSLGI